MRPNHTTCKIALSLVALAISLQGSAAVAGPQSQEEFFNRNTANPSAVANRPGTAPTAPTFGQKTPVTVWFETFDNAVGSHMATLDEKYVLSAEFGSPPQLERVVKWTNTAATVAKRYRELARMVKQYQVPGVLRSDPMAANLVTYKSSLAEWYDDSASLLEDYIKPRPPARTVEQLDDQLAVMHERSEKLKLSMTHLQEMDSKLRGHFNVHPPKYDDALMKYVNKPLKK